MYVVRVGMGSDVGPDPSGIGNISGAASGAAWCGGQAMDMEMRIGRMRIGAGATVEAAEGALRRTLSVRIWRWGRGSGSGAGMVILGRGYGRFQNGCTIGSLWQGTDAHGGSRSIRQAHDNDLAHRFHGVTINPAVEWIRGRPVSTV
jgi:hypothetical protein